MQSIGILFVRDPVVALDLAEILALELMSVRLMTPQIAAQALVMLDSAAFLITDQKGLHDLEGLRPRWSTPTMYLGATLPAHSLAQVTKISFPFTNQTVLDALRSLDLVNLNNRMSGSMRR